MGLFGRSARAEDEESLVQEPYEDLPSLPEPPSSTVIAAGATVTGSPPAGWPKGGRPPAGGGAAWCCGH